MDTYELVDIFMNLDDNERAKFRARRKFLQDEEHNKAVWRGMIAEIEAKGDRIGIFKLKCEIVLKALSKQMSIDDISDLTGFAPDEINSHFVHRH